MATSEMSLFCSRPIVYFYNGAQRYEQFLQVGQLYRALILLSLALFRAPLCLRSSWWYIYIFKKMLTSFSLPFSELSLVRLAPGWLTVVLQCYDTVGWVIWPIKSSPKWPIMCRVGRETLLYHTIPYRQLLKHGFNVSVILIHDTLQATSPFADALINEALSYIVGATQTRSPSTECRGS